MAIVFCIWAVVIPLGFGHRILNSDGDLASHIALARQVMEQGVVFTSDLSHTRPGEDFLAYEWLSGVVLALVHDAGGLAAVVLLSTLLIAGALGLVQSYLRQRVEPALSIPLIFLVAVLTSPHWIGRPHLFTFLAVAILLHVVTRPPSGWRNLTLVALFAVWVNLHPGFLYGLAILWTYLLGDALDGGDAARLRTSALSAVSALGGTLLHPLGWHVHLDILHHLGDTASFGLVQEFDPPDVASLYGALFFACIAAIVLLLNVKRERARYSTVLTFLAAVFAGLVAQRNVTLFALFALPLIVAEIADVLQGRRWEPVERFRRQLRTDDVHGTTVPWVGGAIVLLLALGVGSGRAGPVQLVPDRFSPDVFPVAAVERARAAGLSDDRIFNEYTWGGYLLYAWPEQRIYIDGMANFFGSELMREYESIMLTQEGWDTALDSRGIDLLLLPPGTLLSRRAAARSGWSVWYEDETAVVLRRTDASR